MSSFKKAILDYENHCEQIAQYTSIDVNENHIVQAKRIERAKKDYAFMVEYYFPHYCTDADTNEIIACSDFQKKAAKTILQTKQIDIILNWFRGAAKSTHADIFIPFWLWMNGEMKTMLLVGENAVKANILLSDVQAEFESNERIKRDFGNQKTQGSWEEGEFKLKDNTAFFCIGLGQSPRGLRNRQNRPDYIVVDDADTKKRCKNPRLVREAVEWCLEDLRGAFGTWRKRYVHVNNRIAKTSILEGIKQSLKKAIYLRVVAIKPNGDPSWNERFTKEYWGGMQETTPYRSFQREYMDNPIEEGTVFKEDWIKWVKIPNLKKFDKIVAYCDPSFKGTTKNDFKAIKVWGKIGKDLFLIKSFVRQCSISEMVCWFYDLHEELGDKAIIDYVMEANFMQDMILDDFESEGNERGYQLPIRGDKRKKPDKFQRIEALSPLYERGYVYYNEKLKEDPDMKRAIDQLMAFEKGTGSADDSPDADEGAIYELQKSGRQQKAFGNGSIMLTKRKTRDW